MNDESVARDIVHTIHGIAPKMKIFARAHNLKSSKELIGMGVKAATPEIIESSFTLGANVMENMGISKNKINNLLSDLRADGYANVKKPVNVK